QKQSAPTRSALLAKRRRNCPRQRLINAALPLCAPCPLSRDKANAHERPNAIYHGRFRPRTDCWDHVADRSRPLRLHVTQGGRGFVLYTALSTPGVPSIL